MSHDIPARFRVLATEHWLANHRIDSALPGYLMVASRAISSDPSKLPAHALMALGPLLARAQHTLQTVLTARRVYIGRYGHTPGLPFHFHVIPIYDWVERLFWEDKRYRVLQHFAESDDDAGTDGAELTLFVWREFCERSVPPAIEGPSVPEAINLMREAFADLAGYTVPATSA